MSTADKQRLKAFLAGFYSIGQLQIIYATYTDGGVIPGLTEREKAMRTEAIGELIGKIQPLPETGKPKKSK